MTVCSQRHQEHVITDMATGGTMDANSVCVRYVQALIFYNLNKNKIGVIFLICSFKFILNC